MSLIRRTATLESGPGRLKDLAMNQIVNRLARKNIVTKPRPEPIIAVNAGPAG